jgi:hypothetical protein
MQLVLSSRKQKTPALLIRETWLIFVGKSAARLLKTFYDDLHFIAVLMAT